MVMPIKSDVVERVLALCTVLIYAIIFGIRPSDVKGHSNVISHLF